jgi:hypothetical protein
MFRKTDTAYLCSLMLYIQSNLYSTITVGTQHSTVAGYQANFPSNCSFSLATLFSKVKIKYSFVLHTGFAGSLSYFRIITSYLKMSGVHTENDYIRIVTAYLKSVDRYPVVNCDP